MKTYKSALHFLITLASMFAFLGGWVMLAHSRKPVQAAAPASLAPLPPLQPIQTFNGQASNSSSSGFQIASPQPQQGGFMQAFVTRGS